MFELEFNNTNILIGTVILIVLLFVFYYFFFSKETKQVEPVEEQQLEDLNDVPRTREDLIENLENDYQ